MAEPTGKRLAKLGISLGLAALDAVDGALRPRRRVVRRWSGVVVLHHSVPPAEARRFDRQLALLGRLGEIVPLDDVVAEPDGTWRIAITFDDALCSFAEVAAPLLAARGMPCTLFVPSAVLGVAPPWSRHGEPADRILDADAIRRLPASVTIGSHGRTHRHLTTLSEEAMADEVRGSRDDLTALTGRPIEDFASPFGDHDAMSERVVRTAGYRRSWTVDPVPVRPADAATHGRVSLDPTDSPLEVRLKVRGAYRWMGRYMAWRRARCAPTPRATPAATAASTGRPSR